MIINTNYLSRITRYTYDTIWYHSMVQNNIYISQPLRDLTGYCVMGLIDDVAGTTNRNIAKQGTIGSTIQCWNEFY